MSFLSTFIIKVVLANVYVIRGNILGDKAYLSEWKLGVVVWKRCSKFPTEWNFGTTFGNDSNCSNSNLASFTRTLTHFKGKGCSKN